LQETHINISNNIINRNITLTTQNTNKISENGKLPFADLVTD
jgi:hypothetical protein